MGHIATDWVYDTSACTLDKRVSRVCVQRPNASEMIGFDGNSEGGLRPHYGFLLAHELTFNDVNHDGTSVILDLFPINIKVGSDYYAYGFVYRAQRKDGGTSADVFLEVWDSLSESWTNGYKIQSGVSLTESMSVSVQGRFVFTFIGGEDPKMVYLNDNDGSGGGTVDPPTPVAVTAGVGLQPSFIPRESAGTWGSLNTVGTSGRYGAAQLILTTVPPSDLAADYPPAVTYTGTGQADVNVRPLDPGDYSFAYVLFNSVTGRRSTLSDIAFCRTPDFGTIPNSRYGVVELVWDSSLYDTAYFYRSVRVQSAGGTFTAAILQLDSIQSLDDLEIASDPVTVAPMKHGIYYYKLEDKQIVFQDVFQDRSLSDMTVPRGSCSVMYENTLIVGNVQVTAPSTTDNLRESDLFTGLGEIRWSSLTYPSPEVFPPGNRYVPEVPSNASLCFRNCGGNVIGFGNDRMFFLRKDSGFLRVQEMHEGYGIIGPHAADTVGSLVYLLTSKGLKSVDSDGALDDVRSLNRLVMEQWLIGDLPSASVAFDPRTSALYVLNEAAGEAAVLWFNTGKVTQLRDLPFDRAVRGVWPQFAADGTNDYDGTLQERAFFLQNFNLDGTDDSTDATDWRPRVFVLNERRLKARTGEDPGTRITLMDTTGSPMYQTTEAYTTDSYTLEGLEDFTTGVAELDPDFSVKRLEGAYLYVVQSTNTALVGTRVQVKVGRTDGEIRLVDDGTDPLEGLTAGSILAASPVFCQWAGYPAAVQSQDGEQFAQQMDLFKDRTASAIGCYFTSVNNHLQVEAGYVRFAAGAYNGSSDEPISLAYPRKNDGSTLTNTVLEGESSNYAALGDDFSATTSTQKNSVKANALTPVVQTWVPDVDYRLVAVVMIGAVSDTKRTVMPA